LASFCPSASASQETSCYASHSAPEPNSSTNCSGDLLARLLICLRHTLDSGQVGLVWTYERGKRTLRAHHHPHYGEGAAAQAGRCGPTHWLSGANSMASNLVARRGHTLWRNWGPTRSTCPAEYVAATERGDGARWSGKISPAIQRSSTP
jgi:hypothetical protein